MPGTHTYTISAEQESQLQQAVLDLRAGKLVAIPTETVYGLAANALDSVAVAGIYEAKGRPLFNPLIVHVHSLEAAYTYADTEQPAVQILGSLLWPGPLTMVLPRRPILPDLVTAGLDTVAIRVPDHPLTLELLRRLPFPLAAPSANPSGYVSPTTAAHVRQQLGDKVATILDGGPCNLGLESTIIQPLPELGVLKVLRLGGLTLEELGERAASLGLRLELSIHQSDNPVAPGMLGSHYAPARRLYLDDQHTHLETDSAGNIWVNGKKHQPDQIGWIRWCSYRAEVPVGQQIVLATDGDARKAAARLYSAIRELDARAGIEIIVAELAPATGLGVAINDRLKRAAVKA